jgi:hypothetical protein
VRAALRATPTMRMAPSRSNFPYPASITASKREEKAVTSGRSNECLANGRHLSASFWASSRPAELSFGLRLRCQALRLRRTAHAAVGLDRAARPNERHPCLDGVSMPIAPLGRRLRDGTAAAAAAYAHLTGCRNERRPGRAVMASNASCRRSATNALWWRHR